MIAARRRDGHTAAPALAGATDTAVFQVYVREVLCPTRRPGDRGIMDNLSPPKQAATLALIEQAGARGAFLPAYSPDLNPLEPMGSQVKQCLRRAEARTGEALVAAIAAALGRVTPQDAAQWFAHCGYSFI